LLNDGYAIFPNVLSDSEISELQTWSCEFEGHKLRRAGSTFAARYILRNPVIQDLARKPAIRELASKFVGDKCKAISGTLFDKVAEANWLVPFHQDLTTTVKVRRDAPGFGPWSVKGGLPNVQLPSEILKNMVAIRVHLDDCSVDDGPLRVLPGSHRGGRLDPDGVLRAKSSISEKVCVARRGDVVLMRPLLLHASSVSKSGRPRRVLHIEYAGTDLPHGLEWSFAIS
jgi:ectoine hydroxylase-related dioxygenase (phytanoyl-CoA dioxygenase family)